MISFLDFEKKFSSYFDLSDAKDKIIKQVTDQQDDAFLDFVQLKRKSSRKIKVTTELEYLNFQELYKEYIYQQLSAQFTQI